MAEPGTTNDHVVPIMYLKRWGTPKAGGHQVMATPADDLERAFSTNVRNVGSEKGFYWGETPDGVPHHDMETFLTLIESAATPALRAILDAGTRPTDDALPRRWPPRTDVRLAVSWWLAAQILRTARQRQRLWSDAGEPLGAPRSFRRTNVHLEYIVRNVAPLAQIIYSRPWGVGLTSGCLLTSDVPVQVLNAQDDNDQLLAVSFWDIYVPLDPHRFLLLPGDTLRQRRDLRRDHRINLPGGLSLPLNDVVVETAHRHVFWHRDHDPRKQMNLTEVAAIRHARSDSGGSSVVLSYNTLDPRDAVERRWLDSHVWETDTSTEAKKEAAPRDPKDVTRDAERLVDRLRSSRERYEGSKKPGRRSGGSDDEARTS